MAYSNVLRNDLKQNDIITWVGKYPGALPWPKFMLLKPSKVKEIGQFDTLIVGVLRNGLFHYVEN